MRPVKVAVIGAGYWGPNIIRNFIELPEAELVAVCDIQEERLNHIRSRYPELNTINDHCELLNSDVEAIVIATPVSTHYKLALDCLRAGKHVLIEKPLATRSQEAIAILEAGRQAGKIVMAGHTFLYNPAVIAVRDIIASGEIGKVHYIDSTRVNLGLYQNDINVVWDLAPHDVSILLFLLNMDPVTASARGGMYVKKGVHDIAHLTLNFPEEIMANLHVSWLDPCKIRRITIVGNKKMIVYDDIEPEEKVKIYDKGVDIQPYTDTYEEFQLAYRYGDVVSYPLNWEEPLRAELLHFLQAIRSGQAVRSDGLQGLKVTKILEAAEKSLFNGGMRERISW